MNSNLQRLSAHVYRDPMRDPLGNGYFLYLRARIESETGLVPAYCSDIIFQRRLEPGVIPEDFCTPLITETAAQALMESLWDAGVRPSQAAGSIGQLGAVQAHLQDMRHLAFKGKAP